MLLILKKLISYKSISPSDGGALSYISDLLEKNGFNCYLQEFGGGESATKNLYAEKGAGEKNLCFAGHVDVVPAGDINMWRSDPFKMDESDGNIYGRGAVDMKGAVSAMVSAIVDYSSKHSNKVSILLTSDEEGSGEFGTKKMLEWLRGEGIKIDFAIIGEPTSSEMFGDTIKIGRRGSINFKLKIEGKQGHVAYPELAINPNEILVKILYDLMKWKIDDGNEFFQASNLEIVSIDVGNNVMNVIPQTASAKFNLRSNNIQTSEAIVKNIETIISKHTSNFLLEHSISAEAFLTPVSEYAYKFQELVHDICGVKSEFSTSGGTSDARFIKDVCPLLEFGLLNKTAHQINENCKIIDLQKLYSVYYGAIKSYYKTDY